MVRMGLMALRALTAVTVMIVEQLGLEMMPWWFFTSSGLISGTMSGTSSSRRNAEELSTKTAPALTMAGANCFAMSFSAAPSTMSMPLKASSQASSIMTGRPSHSTTLPALRLLASRCSSEMGKWRSARIFIISRPTAPVAPRMATLYCFIGTSYFTNALYNTRMVSA